MSYTRHVFFCLNERPAPDTSCSQFGSQALQAYAKDRIRALGMDGPGKVRINRAGCLGRCDLGPCLVVYPEAVWYTYTDEKDIDDIVASHLVGGTPVERLRLP